MSRWNRRPGEIAAGMFLADVLARQLGGSDDNGQTRGVRGGRVVAGDDPLRRRAGGAQVCPRRKVTDERGTPPAQVWRQSGRWFTFTTSPLWSSYRLWSQRGSTAVGGRGPRKSPGRPSRSPYTVDREGEGETEATPTRRGQRHLRARASTAAANWLVRHLQPSGATTRIFFSSFIFYRWCVCVWHSGLCLIDRNRVCDTEVKRK